MANALRLMNPHLSLSVTWGTAKYKQGTPTNPEWPKWRPSDPAPASWYTDPAFERLVGAYLNHDRARGRERTVRELVAEFRGLSGTAKQKAVLDASGLARAPLASLVDGQDFVRSSTSALLGAMKEHSKPVQPDALGVIGEDHLRAKFDDLGSDIGTFAYKRISGIDRDLPWVVEVAFAQIPERADAPPPQTPRNPMRPNPLLVQPSPLRDLRPRKRIIYSGVNWSAGITDPFRSLNLESVLSAQRAHSWSPVRLFVHFICAVVHYLDRGKSAIHLLPEQDDAIKAAIEAVTKKWAKTQEALEKSKRAAEKAARRQAEEERLAEEAAERDGKETIKDACARFMEKAWLKASNGGTLPALARQMMYAIRGDVQMATGQKLIAKYFTQTILPDYVTETGVTWDIVFDPRGHFTEPHGGKRFELGTTEARQYLNEVRPAGLYGPGNVRGRYSAVLYIEKEGFDRLFQQLHLADRFDIAIVSTKGNSTTAFRELAETLCSEHEIPLFIAHDFDVAGFTIAGVLGEDGDTRRYQWTKPFRRIDIGLRLTDVEAYGLESESVAPPSPAQIETLCRHGATDAEIKFLASGRRVELNAFMGDGIVRWIESKLIEHGVRKIAPSPEIVMPLYKSSARQTLIDAKVRKYREQVEREIPEFPDSPDVHERMMHGLEQMPSKSWRRQIDDIAAKDAFRMA